MQVVIQQNETKCQVLYDYLKQTYSPALVNHLTQTELYLQKELQDFQKVEEESDGLEELLLEQKTTIQKIVKQLNEKIQSEQDKMKKAETYKKGKKDELSAFQKAIDTVSTAMKETCSKIDIKELNKIGQLPQGMDQFMAQLFSIVYNEDQAKFNWTEFKKKVFDSDKGGDFQSRLANMQFRGVSSEKENLLLQMKVDPQFQKVYSDPKYTKAFLDIADWVLKYILYQVSFVVSGIDTQRRRDLVYSEFDRIDKEFSARKLELESYYKTFEFWNSQLNYSENQLIFLNKFKPNIKQIQSDITKSKQNLEVHADKYLTEARKMNELFQQKI